MELMPEKIRMIIIMELLKSKPHETVSELLKEAKNIVKFILPS